MNLFSKTVPKHLHLATPVVAIMYLLILAGCAYRPVPDMATLNRKWQGKPFSTLVDRLGAPHHTTLHPDGEKQVIYVYTENPLHNRIFMGELFTGQNTIQVQEEIDREERTRCILEIIVRDNRIIRLDASGIGCRDIRENLGADSAGTTE